METVLITDSRETEPREVQVERINGCTVRHNGKTYVHAFNLDSRWVYIPLGQ